MNICGEVGSRNGLLMMSNNVWHCCVVLVLFCLECLDSSVKAHMCESVSACLSGQQIRVDELL